MSVVIPVFDRTIVGEAVESVLAQRGPLPDVVVVDDGSTGEATRRVLGELSNAGGAVRVVHQANAGPSSARNAGVAAARAPLVTFLDSDDLMAPGRLRAQVDAWTAAGGGVFVIGDEQVETAPDVVLPIHEAARVERGERRYLTSMLLHRDDFDRVGGFDATLRRGEDVDLAVRLIDAGVRKLELDQVVVIRRILGDNLVLDQDAVNAALFDVYRRRALRRRAAQSSSPER